MSCYPRLRRLLADVLGADEDELGPETRLSRTGGVDAISAAKLVLRAERAFHLNIRDEDLADLPRLADLAAHIDALLADGRPDGAPPSDAEREAWYYE